MPVSQSIIDAVTLQLNAHSRTLPIDPLRALAKDSKDLFGSPLLIKALACFGMDSIATHHKNEALYIEQLCARSKPTGIPANARVVSFLLNGEASLDGLFTMAENRALQLPTLKQLSKQRGLVESIKIAAADGYGFIPGKQQQQRDIVMASLEPALVKARPLQARFGEARDNLLDYADMPQLKGVLEHKTSTQARGA